MSPRTAPAAAVRLTDPAGAFLGSGFHLGAGLLVSCAHVVHGRPELTARHGTGAHPVRAARLFPPEPAPGAAAYPPPDLALLTAPGLAGAPAVPLGSADPAGDTSVLVHGFAVNPVTGEVGPESALLAVAGPSGLGLRVQQGWIPRGLSGSMAVDGQGRVVGVVKATADGGGPAGGWITPLSALLPLLPPALAPAPAPAARPAVTAGEIARLLGTPALFQDPAARLELVQAVGERLGPGEEIRVPYHPLAALHLRAVAGACLHHRSPDRALRALLAGARELCGPHRALDELGALLDPGPEE
ncbi:trypsin-like peptidase [Kitasatospora sp. SolWspMP-SS2h]|uniref:trypsin-like peptidase domain-containing protein n=1 Tax=Kitasatospora sp. SolWspMP-SS2h TaxID=1305729 RepID=UPI000DBF3D42|nr:trypsin-like peptidase domain-containing protein [Kitasatospora sp. SolWspMP-SS2h]RAJ43616.1 trypsin-like peptidase [Kitasatospora sp. SolWspMP-SS2h]